MPLRECIQLFTHLPAGGRLGGFQWGLLLALLSASQHSVPVAFGACTCALLLGLYLGGKLQGRQFLCPAF